MRPAALNVLDRFHIAKKLGEALDEVRRTGVKQLQRDSYQPVLSTSRYCFLMRPANLTGTQSAKLDPMKEIRQNPQGIQREHGKPARYPAPFSPRTKKAGTPFVWGITRYIRRLTVSADRIAAGQFKISLPARGNDEPGNPGRTIEAMAGRLEHLISGQKRFLGDAAHELCPPLARRQSDPLEPLIRAAAVREGGRKPEFSQT